MPEPRPGAVRLGARSEPPADCAALRGDAIRMAPFGVLCIEPRSQSTETLAMNPMKDQRSPEGEPIPGRMLPREAPQRMWGGTGSGAPCAICGERIGADQLEYELEYR